MLAVHSYWVTTALQKVPLEIKEGELFQDGEVHQQTRYWGA